eukprot:42668-Prorocentrum_minimum.AAC.1
MAEAQSITPKLTHSEVLKSMFYSHGPSNLRPAYYNLHIVMSGNEEPRTRTNYLRADQGPVPSQGASESLSCRARGLGGGQEGVRRGSGGGQEGVVLFCGARRARAKERRGDTARVVVRKNGDVRRSFRRGRKNRRRGSGRENITHSGHQSQKGRENITIAGTNHKRGERIYR